MEDENIANEFNRFFSCIRTNLAENINPCDVPLSFIKPTPHNFTFQTISHDTIREVIMQMKLQNHWVMTKSLQNYCRLQEIRLLSH